MQKLASALLVLLLLLLPDFVVPVSLGAPPPPTTQRPLPQATGVSLPPGKATSSGYKDPGQPPSPFWQVQGISPTSGISGSLAVGVNIGTDQPELEQTDLSLPGRGMNLNITRVFSQPYSYTAYSGVLYPNQFDSYPLANLGIGWSLDFPWLGASQLHLDDGQAFTYPASSSRAWSGNTWTSTSVVDFTLSVTSKPDTCGCTLTLPDGQTYQFNAAYQLVSITDSKGNVISFSYGPDGISQIKDTVGRVVSFTYDGNGYLESIASGGESWNYAYDGLGSLMSVTDPVGRVTSYSYWENNDCPGGNTVPCDVLTGVTYPSGDGVEFDLGVYSPDNTHIVYYVSSVTYSNYGLMDSESITPTFYQNSLSISKVVLQNGGDSYTQAGSVDYTFGPSSVVVQYYNSTGLMMKQVETRLNGQGRVSVVLTYNSKGIIKNTLILGYDGWGNVESSVDWWNGHQQWAYYSYVTANFHGHFSHPGCSNSGFLNEPPLGVVRDALAGSCTGGTGLKSPIETFYEYDSSGDLTEVAQGGLTTTYAYYAHGEVKSELDPLGLNTTYSYSSGSASPTTVTLVGSGYPPMTYSYNSSTGLVTSASDLDGYTTHYYYDAVGRLKEVVPPIGPSTTYQYVGTSYTIITRGLNTTYAYFDGFGRMTESCPQNGCTYYAYNYLGETAQVQDSQATYTYTYDSLGREIAATYPGEPGVAIAYHDATNTETVTDQSGNRTTYAYDWSGRLTGVSEPSATGYHSTTYTYNALGSVASVKDPDGDTTKYAYDSLGRLASVSLANGAQTSYAYDYDGAGVIVSQTNFNGTITTYTYNDLDRLTYIAYPDGGYVSMSYDGDGNPTKVTNQYATVSRTYDPLGDILSETEKTFNSTLGGLAPEGLTTTYSYDSNESLQSLTYPDGVELRMQPSSSNPPLPGSMEVNGPNSCFGSITVEYTPENEVSSVRYPSGETVSYGYSDDRLTSVTDTTAGVSLTYVYGKNGNVKSLMDGTATETIQYDQQDRLTSASGPWGSQSYTYDAAGNILTLTNSSAKGSKSKTTYAYNDVNELTSVNGSSVTYNSNGDMTSDGVWTYTYNAAGEMTQAYRSGKLVQTNYYDGLGRRVAQTGAEGKMILYAYSGAQLLYEDNSTSGTHVDHIYVGGDQVAETVNGAMYYVIPDGLGSTILVKPQSGGAIFSTKYFPYGKGFQVSSQPPKQTLRYVGQAYDPATGLYYMGARFYSPALGRFISPDPFSGVLSDPQSLNRYAYARDDPETLSDPGGMAWWNGWWNSLPAWAQIGIVVGVTIAATALTMGLVTPEVLAVDSGVIAGSVALSEDEEAALANAVTAANAEATADAIASNVASLMEENGLDHAVVVGGGANLVADVVTTLQGASYNVEGFQPSEYALAQYLLGNPQPEMDENTLWIRIMMSSNVPVIDIGPENFFGHPYYTMEGGELATWGSDGYPLWFRMWMLEV
jgi:RHS repeat-associated protein